MMAGRWIAVRTAGLCSSCAGKREGSGDQVWVLRVDRDDDGGVTTKFCPPCLKDLAALALRARAGDDTASMLGFTDLEYRWNQAAASAGYAGQQPEAIFEQVQKER